MLSPEFPNQLQLFTPEAAISILALHRFRCPEVPLEFLHPRLFNPSKPIPELHDDTFDCDVINFPDTHIEDWAA
jgi:hypothetical protein